MDDSQLLVKCRIKCIEYYVGFWPASIVLVDQDQDHEKIDH